MLHKPSPLPLWQRAGLAAAKLFGVATSEQLLGSPEIDWGSYYGGVGKSKYIRWLDRAKVTFLEEALTTLPPGARLLDIACGTGAVLTALAPHKKFQLFGIEPDPVLAGVARRNGIEVVCADFNGELPFAAGAFDAVIMVDAIEHVQCRVAVLNAIKRVLQEQGCLVFFTPPYDSISWILGEHLVYFLTGRLQVGHISPFTAESLAWLLKTNFNQVEIRRFNFGLTMMGVGKGIRY